jgi:hypothetical protein
MQNFIDEIDAEILTQPAGAKPEPLHKKLKKCALSLMHAEATLHNNTVRRFA